MDHPGFERLYRTNPQVALRRATAAPLTKDAYAFLVAHVAELPIETVIRVLQVCSSDDQFELMPVFKRVAQLLPQLGVSSHFLDTLALSTRVPPEVWIHELVLPLRGTLEPFLWYRLVDKTRGGLLFNTLNTGTPRDPAYPSWNPEGSFCDSVERNRAEPTVAPLLEFAHDDLAVARYALANLPAAELIVLYSGFPDFFSGSDVEAALEARLSRSDSWVPTGGPQTLPDWATGLVRKRLERCEEQEAQTLFRWLFEDRPSSNEPMESSDKCGDEAFDVALARFEWALRRAGETQAWSQFNNDVYPFWSGRLGRSLATGTAWKTRGRRLLNRCMRLKTGFPFEIVTHAIRSAGNTAEERERHKHAIVRRAHDETARLLLEFAEEHLHQGEPVQADGCLAAFVCLDPGSFIGGALRRLSNHPSVNADLAEKIETCLELTRTGARNPTIDALGEAFRTLASGEH